jgi:hypothetical protein
MELAANRFYSLFHWEQSWSHPKIRSKLEGDLKPNRVVLYDGRRMHVSDLLTILRKRDQFTDTAIDGQTYQTVKVMVYVPSLKENVSIVIDAKVAKVIDAKGDTKDNAMNTNKKLDLQTLL